MKKNRWQQFHVILSRVYHSIETWHIFTRHQHVTHVSFVFIRRYAISIWSNEFNGSLQVCVDTARSVSNFLFHSSQDIKCDNVSGTVAIGKERNLRRFREFSCYIMQDDRLIRYSTFKDAMMVVPNLKLGKEISTIQKRIANCCVRNSGGWTMFEQR